MKHILTIEQNTRSVAKLTSLLREKDNFKNRKDVRSITVHALAQTSQNYMFSLILSKEFTNLKYIQQNISDQIEMEDLPTMLYNFDGYVKNAFFINFFVYVENHIRQLASFYEQKKEDINQQSIIKTFRNLADDKKTDIFGCLSQSDIQLFEFYCCLRNTMHNGGFHTQSYKSILIEDENSVFNANKVKLELTQNSPNMLNFESQMLIHEQIIKLIFKMNSQIPTDAFIEHRFTQTGFNS